jgi:GR25 family glycosyltransferase involved in LPS biosynthesis
MNKYNIFILICIIFIYKIYYYKYYYELFNNLYKRPSAIIYINLDHRTDRNNSILENIKTINYDNVPVYRISAHYEKYNGHLGCAKSHIDAINMAKNMNLDNVLILEDDFNLNCTPEEFKLKIHKFLNHYKKKWDAIALYSGYKHGFVSDSDGVSKINNGYSTTTVAYLLNNRAFDIFLDNFITSKINLENEMIEKYKPNHKVYQTNYAIDQEWIKLQNSLNFYVFEPNIVKTINSNSEINKIIEKFYNIFNPFKYINSNITEKFINYTTKPAPDVDWPLKNIRDENGNNLNIIALSAPFRSDDNHIDLIKYKKEGYPILGVTSYLNFPGKISNPHEDPYYENNNDDYINMCIGWLTCFRDLTSRNLQNIPTIDIAESDFKSKEWYTPSPDIKDYDFIYSCTKDDDYCTDGWQSYNRNWKLFKKLMPILFGKYKLKGLLVGRKNCDIDEKYKKYVTLTDFLPYWDFIDKMKKSRFIMVPNYSDASPRVITEALALDLPVLMNKNIYGGWKYINNQTGEFFSNENDFEPALLKILSYNYKPRKWFFDNYGNYNTGIKLKNFIKGIFPQLNDCEYVTF